MAEKLRVVIRGRGKSKTPSALLKVPFNLQEARTATGVPSKLDQSCHVKTLLRNQWVSRATAECGNLVAGGEM